MEFKYKESITFNYANVFFSHYFNNDTKCTHMAKNHYLVYVFSGEVLVEEGDNQITIHKGECAFIRKNNRVNLTKQPKDDERSVIIIAVFFITSANSRILVMNTISSDAKKKMPKWQNIVWAVFWLFYHLPC